MGLAHFCWHTLTRSEPATPAWVSGPALPQERCAFLLKPSGHIVSYFGISRVNTDPETWQVAQLLMPALTIEDKLTVAFIWATTTC
jgi:hypothetical protein